MLVTLFKSVVDVIQKTPTSLAISKRINSFRLRSYIEKRSEEGTNRLTIII